ncbi:hypothetical protein OSB04_007710 [Centaurea solstitialis]|uniref:Uncharacterized protein n=1 Tax=Centaurea solstitialis TaxID=347529 RepID=A0AA38WR07_9ASTR|nr:hypothetical protein OSB04_007710 [Centaurea solstitialis]
MGRNAARRAASSSTATASSEAVSMVATELVSLATTNSRLIDAISQRQRKHGNTKTWLFESVESDFGCESYAEKKFLRFWLRAEFSAPSDR